MEERTSIPEILTKDCILKCLMGKASKSSVASLRILHEISWEK